MKLTLCIFSGRRDPSVDLIFTEANDLMVLKSMLPDDPDKTEQQINLGYHGFLLELNSHHNILVFRNQVNEILNDEKTYYLDKDCLLEKECCRLFREKSHHPAYLRHLDYIR